MRKEATRDFSSWNVALLAFIGLSALDVVSTWIGLQAGMREGNVLASALMSEAGIEILFAFKLLVVCIVTGCLIQLGPVYPRLWGVLKFANVYMTLVVLFNSVQILMMF